MKIVAVALAVLVAASSLEAQNTTLRSHLDSYSSYNDIWGYHDPVSHREIAILGTFSGTSFVETTNPASPVELKFIARSSSTWADHRTYQQYAYIVTEGGGGLQIVDLSDLDNIQLVATSTASFQSAHNIHIDEGAGLAYIPGANTGMPVLHLANPTAPTEPYNYTFNYCHDAYAFQGIGLLSEIYAGDLRIVDTSNLPGSGFTNRGNYGTPGNFTHNAWGNADNTIAVTTDEVTGGKLAVWDISSPASATLLSQYTDNPSAIIHNALIQDNIAHISYYTEGYVAVDISDPSSPVKLGQYDTYPGPSGGFNGAWGVYPFQPSGVIYVSDIGTGLYVLELNCRPPVNYGGGHAGSGGFVPTIESSGGLPQLGNGAFQIQVDDCLGGSPGFLFFGFGAAEIPYRGIDLLFSLSTPFFMFPRTVSGPAGVPGAGSLSFPAPIPNVAAGLGTTVYAQFVSLDAGGSQGFASSAGLAFTICQ